MSAPKPPTVCASISRFPSPLGRAMHDAGYRALGLNFLYVPFACRDIKGAVAGVRALSIRGAGISMPFKVEILPLLDGLDELARRIGAVNTVVNDGGHLVGHNTDAVGARRALEERGELGGRSALVLGAGGAARAIALGLLDAGVRVSVTNRGEDRLRELAASLPGLETLPWADRAAAARDADLVVNATSLGMADVDPASPLPAEALRPGQRVLDAVFKPVQTALLAEAARAGATAIDGTRMLLHQAMAQFTLYTGLPAPQAAMEAGLRSALGGP
ncbi:MAG TPA: shikimate dehydrogenase [Polyangiaceae bacterium]|nr:shikimate dehydrogenase [Polyangiaceae bacterium]